MLVQTNPATAASSFAVFALIGLRPFTHQTVPTLHSDKCEVEAINRALLFE